MRYFVDPSPDPPYEGYVDIYKANLNITGLGNINAFLYGMEEDAEPHFHLKDINGNDICIIELCNNKYIGGKKLNSTQCSELYKWLKSMDTDHISEYSHWKSMITFWNGCEGNYTTDEYKICDMPNYNIIY